MRASPRLGDRTDAERSCGWVHGTLGALTAYVDALATTTTTTTLTTTTTTAHENSDKFQEKLETRRVENLQRGQATLAAGHAELNKRLAAVEQASADNTADVEDASEQVAFQLQVVGVLKDSALADRAAQQADAARLAEALSELQSAARESATLRQADRRALQAQFDLLAKKMGTLENTVGRVLSALGAAAQIEPDGAFSTDGVPSCSGSRAGCRAAVASEGDNIVITSPNTMLVSTGACGVVDLCALNNVVYKVQAALEVQA